MKQTSIKQHSTQPRPSGTEQISSLRNHLGMSLKRIAEEAGLSSPQTLAGEGQMLSANTATGTEPQLENDHVPLLPVSAFAGPIQAFSEGVMNDKCETVYSPTRGAELALTISGDSMEPMLHDGTIIFIKRINELAFIPWGHTLVIDTENGAFVKDVYPGASEDQIVARSKNPKYPEIVIPKSSIYGVYRVLNAVKSFGLM